MEDDRVETWLTAIRDHVLRTAPELLPVLDIYEAEARFGRRYIDDELRRLPAQARVLEVGAGCLLLSCQLVREGFDVVALEPTGDGFSHFDRLRTMVLERAHALGCQPTVLDQPAETLAVEASFDFAFSVNVMEHVDDVRRVIANVGRSLKPGATYRFTCANYLFPYEPHFNIPTVLSKDLTLRLFRHRIEGNRAMDDPAGVWRSLNWITVPRVRGIVRRLPDLDVAFNARILASALERLASDPAFASRRSPVVRTIIAMLVKLRLHRLAALVPAALQPLMDCALQRRRMA